MSPRRRSYERTEEVSRRCDICANRAPDSWWIASYPDIILPDAMPDPDIPGRLLPLRYPAEQPWGVCGECRDCIENFEALDIIALEERCSRYLRPGIFVAVLRIVLALHREAHPPWEPFDPPPSGIRRSWIEH